MKKRNVIAKKVRQFEMLEDRRCCAAVSSGWDGPGRGTANLTYYVGSVPSSMSRAAVEAAIETALNAWSQVAGVRFTKTNVPSQIRSLDFNFQQIDGAGGTLAQAYLPADVNSSRLAGDVTFDISEKWEVGNSLGNSAFDLVEVAVHEIGHALGLEHSETTLSVMQARVGPDEYFTQLSSDDKAAILALYAPASTLDSNTSAPGAATPTTSIPTTATPTTATPTTTPTRNDNFIPNRSSRPTGIPLDWNSFRRFARSWAESWRVGRNWSLVTSHTINASDSGLPTKSNSICSVSNEAFSIRPYDLRT